MKIPDQTRIKTGPVHYTITYVPDLQNGDGETLYGQAFHRDFQIRLNGNHHTPESAFTTTWHELLHTAENIYGLDLPESTVTILGAYISQLLQDNPALNWKGGDE
jgi:hypothetical protein